MQCRDHLGAFADGGRDPFGRAAANIAYGEDAVAAGFHQAMSWRDVRPGSDEALGVERHVAVRQPVRVRIGADEQKDMVDSTRRFRAGCAVAPAYLLEIAFAAFQGLDLRLGQHLDVRLCLDALDQVARHGGIQIVAPREQRDLAHVARQEDRRLAGRIAGADERHLLVPAKSRLDRRGPIMDGGSFELRQVRQVETAVARAAGDHDGACMHCLAIADGHRIASARQAGGAEQLRLVGDNHLDAEFLCLIVGTRHQGHSRNAGRKAEIVFDARGGACLSAEGAAIENDRRKPFRGGIDRGGQTRRAGADDGHVVDFVRVHWPQQADTAGEFVLARIVEQLAVWAKDDRQMVRVDVEALDQGPGAGVGVGIEGAVRHATAG